MQLTRPVGISVHVSDESTDVGAGVGAGTVGRGTWVCSPGPCTCPDTGWGVGALVGDGTRDEIVGSSVGTAVRASDGERVRILVGGLVGRLVGGVVGMLVGGVVGMLVGGVVRALVGDFIDVDTGVWMCPPGL